MKPLRSLLFPALAVILTSALPAQTRSQPPIKSVEPARVAYVNSGQFLDPATGIKQLVRAAQSLELEFSSTQSELSLLNEKLRTIAGEINKLRNESVVNAKALEEKQAAGLKMQQELQGKQQEAQAAFNKRQQEVQGPVAAEIGKELRAFAQERNITMLFDAAKLGDALLDASPGLDLTGDFIAYFNAKHQ